MNNTQFRKFWEYLVTIIIVCWFIFIICTALYTSYYNLFLHPEFTKAMMFWEFWRLYLGMGLSTIIVRLLFWTIK